MEMTSLGRIRRIGHITLQYYPYSLDSWVRQGDRGKQSLCIGMCRMCIQVLFVRNLHNTAKIHDSHPAAYVVHHGQVVGNKDIGQVQLLFQAVDQIQNLSTDGTVIRGLSEAPGS